MTTTTRTSWRATTADGIAHAFGRLPHALCGVRNQPEKFDWPAHGRCPDCMYEEEERKKRKAS